MVLLFYRITFLALIEFLSLIEIKKLTTEISLTSEELQMLLHKYVSNTNGNTSSMHQQQRMENGLRPNVSFDN